MCELDDYGVQVIIHAADIMTSRCNHEPCPPDDCERWHEE